MIGPALAQIPAQHQIRGAVLDVVAGETWRRECVR